MGIFPGKAVTDIGEKVVYHSAGAGCPKPFLPRLREC
jgi:hypothetical protein